MKKIYFSLLFIILVFVGCSSGQTPAESIVKIEMNMSAFGVESDDFPSIDCVLDFVAYTSRCERSYYNPAYKGSTYSLSKEEMQSILKLLKVEELDKLKKEYTVTMSDQPTSTIKIYTTKKVYQVSDYGMVGEYPLEELYDIVYKLRDTR